ncbi:L-serine ammonia-lyase, iron-sulfur-dependent, subunit alpha [Hutsoniella sourekii]|uniref:L-serine ammonia-lyase, iron-sulfur-dependent, subunit alpha n=1 Tax=Hutsoniella sourekii TaxID=87650 RepID=UPI000488D2DE
MSFTSLEALIKLAEEKQTPISELMIQSEIDLRGVSRDQLIQEMADQFEVMVDSVRQGTLKPAMSKTGLTGGDGHRVYQYLEQGDPLIDPTPLQALANAMAVNEVNAAMGRIVATPTAGSAGILPAVLVQQYDTDHYQKEDLIQVMFTAAAFGMVVANRASIAGATGGCQAEIGSATAMSAAALVELRGGSPSQSGQAFALALKNSLGLVCDPVAGLVEIPCIVRNGFHALTALAACDMALAGVQSVIPADEVIDAMGAIGQEMPASLRETGIGGLAGTKTGCQIKEEIFGQDQLEEESTQATYQSAYEVIGPIMIGPSSSHTAGAVRIGNVARQLLGEEVEEVVFVLMGSFAETYQGHGTDKALISGVLGYTTKDEDIAQAEARAEERGLTYHFVKRNLGFYHPNTVEVNLWGATNHVQLIASSIGGGKIEVQELNDYPIKFSGDQPTLLVAHQDRVGAIASLSHFLQEHDLNVSHMANRRSKIHGPALSVFELDQAFTEDLQKAMLEACPFILDLKVVKTN